MIEQLGLELSEYWSFSPETFKILAQRENTVFRAETNKGPIVIRMHRQGYHDFDEIQSELQFMVGVSSHFANTPCPIATKDGRLVVEHRGKIFTGLDWITGKTLKEYLSLTSSKRELETIFFDLGGKLANFHIACDAWQPPLGFKRHSWNRSGLIGINPFWGRFWENPDLHQDERDFMLKIKDRINAVLAGLEDNLDYGMIHADLIPDNVMIDEDELIFLDFDDCGFGFRIFDLATILQKQFIAESNFKAISTALVTGYKSHRKLETEHLDLFLAIRSLTYVGWIVDRYNFIDATERSRHYINNALLICKRFQHEL